jgi:chloramphenicol O-acetyltransferase type A
VKHKLNLDSWNRKEHFLFFKQMDEPFFGVTTRVDCTHAYEKSKALGISFFAYYLHKTLLAVNSVENFRYRIYDNDVYVYDRIDASATIMREDQTFGFSLIEHAENLHDFAVNVKEEIARIQTTTGLFTRPFTKDNLIHFSALPWIDFSSFSHARSFQWADSCPKISFGKMMEADGKRTMAVSVHVHHGLVDGLHIGQFFSQLDHFMKD